ncbi:protein O-mannosyl-transferase TMTC4 isoform X4 [Denticeps clupeoides]|uniref:protein O-mannosyl-transferase TMTC4 isoform X4 n=1 Tax=Denticeps clupeoides TaxID=299321 RepID=UPI0010A32348|nr:protein O-mannosyl-transferase TMTC4 isoform X4 [Denticeps clupeoides]
MVLSEANWDHHVPLPKLGAAHSRILVGLLALVCFINSYDGEFVFDDSEAIVNNKDLHPSSPLNNIWTNDFWGSNLSSNSSHKSYRPLTVLTFRMNYLLAGGLHPVGFHVLNIALHCVISALMIDVFAILIGGLTYDSKGRRLNQVPRSSLLAALLFAVHPVHTESVAGIVGRADLLCALFFQFSFLAYCRAFRGGNDKTFSVSWVAASFLLCAAAMLCKEQGITVLGVNAAFDILLICNVNIGELTQRLLLKGKPVDMNALVRSRLVTRLTLLLFGGGVLLYARWRIMGTGPPAFTEVDNPASFAENVFLRKLLQVAMMGLLCVNIGRSAQRSQQWRSEQSLFTSALSVCPLNAKVHYNVGKNLADRGNQMAAVQYYREAVRLHPRYVHAMNNLGNILKEKNELVEAEELLTAAVHIQPDFAAAWMNLGIVQNSLKKFAEAEQSYWNAIKYRRKYPDCYYNLGRLVWYADLNRHVDALNAWRNATMLKPDHSLAWNNMVILLDNTGNLAQAEMIGREALVILPNDHTIMFSLANVLGKLQKYKESEGFFLHSLKINPSAASCHGNLAVLYHRWGKLDLAKKHYELSLKLDANAPGTRENYSMLRRKLDQLQKTKG